MKKLNDWFQLKLLNWAARLVRSHGYTVTRIETIAGADYIRSSSGELYRIGKKK